MPISSSGSYDRTGASYDVTKIITNGLFDEEKYKAYSPLFIPATFIISYGVQFAAITAVIVHTFRTLCSPCKLRDLLTTSPSRSVVQA